MSNIDSKTKAFFDRVLRLETEKREIAESMRDLAKEMKGVGLGPEEIAGIKLAVKRHFETEDKKATREAAESVAEALGDFKDTPIGAAAVERAKPKPKVHFDGTLKSRLGEALREIVADANATGSTVTLRENVRV